MSYSLNPNVAVSKIFQGDTVSPYRIVSMQNQIAQNVQFYMKKKMADFG